MEVYIPFIIFVSVGALSKNKKWFYRVALVLLFLMSAFRSELFGGSDAKFYRAFFNSVPTLSELTFEFLENQSYGPAFILVSSIAKTISNNYLFFQAFLSLLSIVLLNEVIKRVPGEENDDALKLQFLVVYFCYRFIYNNWISLRQNFANLIIWIVLLSLGKKQDRKGIIKQILLIIVAYLFHSTSMINLILIPAILLLNKFDIKKKITIVIPTSLVLMVFSHTIFIRVLNIFTTYIDARYVNYSISDGGNIINFLLRVICLYILYINIAKIKDPKKTFMFDILLTMCLIGSINVAIVIRFYEYYAIGLYYTLANIPRMYKKDRQSYLLSYSLVLFAIFIIFLRFCITMDSGLYLHYHLYN